MDLGYAVVSNGWDFGASGFDSMKISVPVATNSRESITGPSYEYIVHDNPTTLTHELAFPAATNSKSLATLTVRERAGNG